MSKKNAKTVATPVTQAVEPVKPVEKIDAAILVKKAQDEACVLIPELSSLDNKRERIGEKLTNALIVIFNNTAPGNARDLAMRPLYDAVVKARANGDESYGEKQARKYLSNYISNARKAIDLQVPVDNGASVSITAVNKAAAEKNGQTSKTSTGRGGQVGKVNIDKAMDYLRPMLEGLKDTPSSEGAYQQATQLIMWIARECKYEAVYNGQHKTLVVTVK